MFGLELHPEKTRLIEFGRFAASNREKRGEGKPETFTFLGFTHHCGKRRSNGSFIVWRKTAKKRMVAKLHALKAELRRRMHEPVADVGAWLRKVVNGYYRYHAVPGNIDRFRVFIQRLRRLWRLILLRRSQQRRSWDGITRISTAGFQSHAFCTLILPLDFSLLIQGGSRMRRRARTVLCGGRSAMIVPTASPWQRRNLFRSVSTHQFAGAFGFAGLGLCGTFVVIFVSTNSFIRLRIAVPPIPIAVFSKVNAAPRSLAG